MLLGFDTHGNEKQKLCAKAWASDIYTDIVYGGSKGSAKSFTGCSLIFGDAFIYPGTHYFIARAKLNDLRKHTLPSIHEVFGIWELSKSYWKYNASDSVFTLYNGSKVFMIEAKYLPSDPMYQRFGSMQMTRGWIEEAGEFSEDAKTNLQATVGRWKNDKYNLIPKLLQTCNPSKGYLYREYYQKNKNNTLEPHKCFIQALPQDNKMLAPGYLEHLNNILKGAAKQRLLLGNWEYDDDPNALIEYDNITNLFTNDHVTEGTKYITADIARMGSDKAVIYVWSGYRIIEIVEFEISKTTVLQDAITALKVKHQIPNSNIIADEDGVGGGVVDNLQIKGFVNNSSPINKENYSNLKSQCYYKLAELINENKIYIQAEVSSKQKEDIIEELEQVKQHDADKDGKLRILPKEDVKSLIGRSPDYTDAMMMRIYFDLSPEVTMASFRF